MSVYGIVQGGCRFLDLIEYLPQVDRTMPTFVKKSLKLSTLRAKPESSFPDIELNIRREEFNDNLPTAHRLYLTLPQRRRRKREKNGLTCPKHIVQFSLE